MYNSYENSNFGPTKSSELLEAAKTGDKDTIERLILNQSINANNVRDDFGRTPLMLAAENGHAECVHVLLENCKMMDATISTNYEQNALMLAADCGRFECVKLLIDKKGFDINACDVRMNTALLLSAKKGFFDCVKYIAESDGTVINKCGLFFRNALMQAALNGHTECVEYLSSTGAIDINAKDIYGQTALMLVIGNGHFGCARWFLANENVDIQASDKCRRTAFMLAAAFNCHNGNKFDQCHEFPSKLSFALDKDRDNIQRRFLDIRITEEIHSDLLVKNHFSEQTETTLSSAFTPQFPDASCRYLPGITWRRPYVYKRNQEGQSVLRLVVRNGMARCAICFILGDLDIPITEKSSCSHTLLDNSELRICDCDGNTALIIAVMKRQDQKVEYLLQYERIRLQILVLLMKEELSRTGTISLILYKKLCSLILNHRQVDIFLGKICGDNESGECVDYLLSAFICRTNGADKSAFLYSTSEESERCFEMLLEHITDKRMLYYHIVEHVHKAPRQPINLNCALDLLEAEVFHWSWYPRLGFLEQRILTKELVMRGYTPRYFKWRSNTFSPLLHAFRNGDIGLVHYLLANLYMTSLDLKHFQRDVDLRDHVTLTGSDEIKTLHGQLCETPWRLEALSFLTVSTLLRNKQRRKDVMRLNMLPEVFRSLLAFKRPIGTLCIYKWNEIEFNFLNQRLSAGFHEEKMTMGQCSPFGCQGLHRTAEP